MCRGNNKECKQCDLGDWETLEHYILDCDAYTNIRRLYDDFPTDLKSFFEWGIGDELLELLHKQREE